MNDDAILTSFEAGTFPLERFDHAMHVRVAWIYAGRLPPEVALLRLCAGLRELADRAGHPEKFHATITWAYAALIGERWREGESFDAFSKRCPELFDGSALREHYLRETLHEPRAREAFLLPRTDQSGSDQGSGSTHSVPPPPNAHR